MKWQEHFQLNSAGRIAAETAMVYDYGIAGGSSIPMAESVTQPGIEHTGESETTTPEHKENIPLTDGLATPQTGIIWTPFFMALFALLFVLGLSADALLADGWMAHFYLGQWIMHLHVIVAGVAWLALAIFARSEWVRIAGIFGCIWAIFMSIDIVIIAASGNPASPLIPPVNAAICIALLGAYICLSRDQIPFRRWDALFFGLAPIGGVLAVVLAYFLTPAGTWSLGLFEGCVAATALVLATLVWWLRPSCWKAQPGPTFFFGIAPLTLLLLAIPSMGFNESNFFLAQVVLAPASTLTATEANFFFSEVAILCLILGALRILRG
ncbi:MAG TPA: hypothetical protein VJ761_06055, partial [Ktedonobacteraceae bacterium]|nr:hypothetical protein [Ktedonobacteraceae bacterium]